jgi:hypothetical protein
LAMSSWWQLGEDTGHEGHDLALYKIECAFCGERGNWGCVFHEEMKKPNGKKRLNFDVYRCGNCAAYTHVMWSISERSYSHAFHGFCVLPYPLKTKPEPSGNWPPLVQRFWMQAHQSLSAEIWDGASVMTRSAMQVTLREQGAKGRTLKDEIEDLAVKNMLPPAMKEWSTELRLLGNESAHPELDQTDADPQDIRDAIQFLDLLLNYIYDLPAQIKLYRDRRNGAET